jgi:diguanylate cyclase (GGDEF)-like protein
MAAAPDRQRSPLFDYANSVDPAMSAFGWRFIVLSYLAVLVPLLGIALPRDAETHWGIVASVLLVALATLTLNATYLRQMLATAGWAEPPGVVVLGQALVVTVATGWLNYALSGAGGFYRPMIFVPAVLVAVIGNRAMAATTTATAFLTLVLSTWAQGTETRHLPAFVVSYGATWGLLILMIRLLSARALQATTLTQGIADAAAIAARADRLDDGLERLLPVVGAWAVAERVTAFALADGDSAVLESWPAGIGPCPAPPSALIAQACADDGAAVDGSQAVIVADRRTDGASGPATVAVAVVVQGAARARFDAITYHYQLTRMAAQLETLVSRSRHIEHLESLGRTDSLTGLPNRRSLEERLDLERTVTRRRGEPLTLAMIDLDDFKAYNDTHGHPAGDDLLQRFAAALRDSVRASDLVARYGGEEFCVLLPNTTASGAEVLIDQLRIRLRSGALTSRPAFSAGVATWMEGDTSHELLKRADRALYAAKAAGKDCTVVA